MFLCKNKVLFRCNDYTFLHFKRRGDTYQRVFDI